MADKHGTHWGTCINAQFAQVEGLRYGYQNLLEANELEETELHPRFMSANQLKRQIEIVGTLIRAVSQAIPFYWTAEVVALVEEASRTLPNDLRLTDFVDADKPTETYWWYLQSPIQRENRSGAYAIQAISVIGPFDDGGGLYLAAYAVDPKILPITLPWKPPFTLGEHCEIGIEESAANEVSKGRISVRDLAVLKRTLSGFVAAGLTWLKQRIVVKEQETITPKRQETLRKLAPDCPARSVVNVIHLRAFEKSSNTCGKEERKRQLRARFVVGGHWRNQAHGPAHSQRRLIYILPYLKGPKDTPVSPQKPKIIMVDR